MADQLFVETLMERIRSQVRTDARGSTPETRASVLSQGQVSAADQVLFRLRQYQPGADRGTRRLKSYHEFAEVRAELESCLIALDKFGEVNPRPAGYWNDRIQTCKRFIRRALVWSVRPLRLFHRAVIRTLQQLLAALDKQQDALADCALTEDLVAAEARLDDLEQGTWQVHELARSAMEETTKYSLSAAESQQALREDLLELRSEVAATRRQLEELMAQYRSREQSLAPPINAEPVSRPAGASRKEPDEGHLS
ncbi:MAG TPA: hypothetical protein VE779_17865 [Candidatus Angelobacter sp.]|nr:hypothetical protein [Candidatus Angelobacter sp.]